MKLYLPTDIPLLELLSLAEDVHVKTQVASQKTGFDMHEFLRIYKILQSTQDKLGPDI